MKHESAIQAGRLVNDLDSIHTQQKHFENTKEFCNVRLDGEDGNERSYHMDFHYSTNFELIDIIRNQIKIYLDNKETNIKRKIERL